MSRHHLALITALAIALVALEATALLASEPSPANQQLPYGTLNGNSAKILTMDGADIAPRWRNNEPWPELIFDENQLLRRSVILNLDDYFEDPEDPEAQFRYSVVQTPASIRTGFGIRLDNWTKELSFQFQPFYNTWGQQVEIVIHCDNLRGEVWEDVIPASIDSVNFPPQLRGLDIVFSTRNETNRPIVGDIVDQGLLTRFWDPDSDLLDFSLDVPPEELGLRINQAAPRIIHFNIAADYNTAHLDGDSAIITVRAMDHGGLDTFRTFGMTIRPDANDPISAGEAGSGFEYLTPADGFLISYADSSEAMTFSWRPAIQNPWETDSIAYHIRLFAPGSRDTIRGAVIDDTMFEFPIDSLIHQWRSMERPGMYRCYWNVYAVDRADVPLHSLSGTWWFDLPHVSGSDIPILPPDMFSLSDPYPNPFNSSTTIRYSLPSAQPVSLRVYDLTGREVAVLVEERTALAGAHAVTWDANGIGAGVYICRLESGTGASSIKLVITK